MKPLEADPERHPPSSIFERLLAIVPMGFAAWAIYVFVASSPPTAHSLTRFEAHFEQFESVAHGWEYRSRRSGPRPSTSYFVGRTLDGQRLRLAFPSEALPSSPGIYQGRTVTVLTDPDRSRLYEMTAYGHPVVFRSAIESQSSSRRTLVFMLGTVALVAAAGCLRADIRRLAAARLARHAAGARPPNESSA